MKATYLFLALFAFGHAQIQEKERNDRRKIKDSISVLDEIRACPQECSCNSYTKDPSSRQAICSSLPKSIHPNIRYLKVTGNIGTISIKAIQEIEGQLFQLDLSGCNISRIETGTFDSLVHLVSLNLSNNNIKTINNDMFTCPRLIYLYLNGNALQVIQNTAFSELKKLTELHLQHNLLQEISFGLPVTLNDLDISHNNISTITTDLSKLKLKILDICGNPLREFPSTISSKTLEVLCLEGEAAHLPNEAAADFPRLHTITLVGSHKSKSELDMTTQYELAKMRKLMVLTIVNHHLKSLSFLAALENLEILKLQNVTVESYNEMYKSLQHLVTLNIDWSPTLVKPILNNTKLLTQLSNLKTLSLKHTGLLSLSEHNIPAIEHLDISKNPLHCDCKLLWIQHKERDQLSNFLLSKLETTCTTPSNAARKTLQTIVNIVLCDENQTDGKLVQQDDIQIPTTTFQYDSRTTPDFYTTPKHITTNSTEHPQQSHMTEKSDYSTLYIILGCVVGILILMTIILAVVLTMKKRKRQCQISPNEGETPMQQPIKQAKSSDQLLKK